MEDLARARFGIRHRQRPPSLRGKSEHEVARADGATEADIVPPAQRIFAALELASGLVIEIRVEGPAADAFQRRGAAVALIAAAKRKSLAFHSQTFPTI